MSDNTVDLTKPLNPGVQTTAIVVKTPKGEKVLLKDEATGKFVRKKRPLPDGREVTRAMRKALLKMEAGPDGKLTKGSKSRVEIMVDNMFRIASTTSDDPKDKAVAVQAFKEVMTRAWGTPSRSDEDVEKENSGIKFVIVAPPQLMHKEPLNYEEMTKQPAKPSFIDAEIVKQG